MFTKQHYKAIAEIIDSNTQHKGPPQNDIDEGVRRGGKYIALALADYFPDDNPLFDRQKFLEACGTT